MSGIIMLDNLRQDVAFAVRLLRQAPAFTATAILTIALAVGLNAAVFSIVNAFMIRPLPVPDSGRLIVIATHRVSSMALGGVSYSDLEDYRAAAGTVFEDLAGYNVGFLGLRIHGKRAERVLATTVTGNYFSLLGVRPALGRFFDDEEGGPHRADPVVVLGYSTWQRRFDSDYSVIGKRVNVNGTPCTIIGVAPRGFSGVFAFSDSELYLPLNWSTPSPLNERGSRWLHGFGRLREDVTLPEAQALMDIVAPRLAREHPEESGGVAVVVIPEPLARPIEDAARSNRFIASVMLGLVALVLLVGTANVVNLLLARAFERQKEIAIRASLGASRWRVVRQLIIESLVLAGAGGVAGVLIAVGSGRAAASVRVPGDLPLRLDFHLDMRVLGYAAVLVIVTGILAGVLPAVRATRLDLQRVLNQGSDRSRSGGRGRTRTVLVVSEIAATLVLLVATALFVRSLHLAEHVDLGFDAEPVLNVQMDVAQLGYTEAQGRAFFSEVETHVRRIPGVVNTTFAFTVPLGYVYPGTTVDAEGQSAPASDRLNAGFNLVDSEYFETMGIRIERGRAFTSRDDGRSRRVAVVNRRLAERLWPGADPVGRRVSTSGTGGPWIEVVGVTPTGKYHFLFEEPLPFIYLPLAQHYTGLRALHVRTAQVPEQLAPSVERAIRSLEPDLPLYDVQSMRRALGGGFGFLLVRAGALAGAVFGALGLALALVGVYGVTATVASQRRHELGVRMALGASPRDLTRLLLTDGTIFVISGSAMGLAVAVGVARAMQRLIFAVAPMDFWAFGVATAVLASAALIGCGIPAWRAARRDPMLTLRLE